MATLQVLDSEQHRQGSRRPGRMWQPPADGRPRGAEKAEHDVCGRSSGPQCTDYVSIFSAAGTGSSRSTKAGVDLMTTDFHRAGGQDRPGLDTIFSTSVQVDLAHQNLVGAQRRTQARLTSTSSSSASLEPELARKKEALLGHGGLQGRRAPRPLCPGQVEYLRDLPTSTCSRRRAPGCAGLATRQSRRARGVRRHCSRR